MNNYNWLGNPKETPAEKEYKNIEIGKGVLIGLVVGYLFFKPKKATI